MTASVTLDLVAPAYWWAPEYDRTLGPEVVELATMAGFTPDPEQRMLLDATFAIQRGGRTMARDVGICAPRQNLKTGFLKQAALGWLFVNELRLIVWSAHEFGTAQEAFRDMCVLIETCPDLDAEVKQIHYGNGEESIELTKDRRLKFKARTKSGGRGLTGDRIVLDEAMYLTASHMGALVPTLRAVDDPQLVLAGSAGLMESAVWRGYRDRGRPGGAHRLVWAEWGDRQAWKGCRSPHCNHLPHQAGCALDDRDRWRATNSALGRRITEESLELDRTTAFATKPVEFARETLSWWEDPPEGGVGKFDESGAWEALADPAADRGQAVVFGVAEAPDRTWAAIAVGWRRPDGVPHFMLADYKPGTAWVGERVAELRAKWGGQVFAPPKVLDGAEEVSGAHRAAAANGLSDALATGRVRHGNQAALNVAVAAARWRMRGEDQVLDRRGEAEISPLVAVVMAWHGLSTAPVSDGYVL